MSNELLRNKLIAHAIDRLWNDIEHDDQYLKELVADPVMGTNEQELLEELEDLMIHYDQYIVVED